MKRAKNVKTPDDWYPTAPNGTVSVFVGRRKTEKDWHVSVWGDDDFGLELGGLDIKGAFDTFRNIKNGVTQKDLRKLNFINA